MKGFVFYEFRTAAGAIPERHEALAWRRTRPVRSTSYKASPGAVGIDRFVQRREYRKMLVQLAKE